MGGVSNLPVTIYQFALSPYPNWQQLAWAGALLITITILGLSIVARFVIKKDVALMSAARSPPSTDRTPIDERRARDHRRAAHRTPQGRRDLAVRIAVQGPQLLLRRASTA